MKDETFQECKKIYEEISKEPDFNPEKYFWEFGSKTMNQLLKNNIQQQEEEEGIWSLGSRVVID